MYSISSAFANELANDNRAYLIQLDFTLANGTTFSLDNSSVWQGGLRFEEAVSGDSEFQIGGAVIGKLNITMNNISDQFSEYVFEGATVVAYVGLTLNDGTIQMVKRGTYIVDSVTGQNASLIKLECLDFMARLDVPYKGVNTVYPASLGSIVRDICSYCSVGLQTATFDGSTFLVTKRPSSDGLTCRQVLAYAAQIACKFAKMNADGSLCLNWFTGTENNPQHSFTSIYNISTSQYTVAITGVRVTEFSDGSDTLKNDSVTWGQEGYVLDIANNELIQYGKGETVAQMVGQKIVGVLSFKTVDATITSDPSVEAGDTAVIIDEKGNSAFFPITRVIFETDNSMSVSCSAKTPARNAATIFNQLTRAIILANNYTEAKLSNYDRASLELSRLMSESFGVFVTEVPQQDGSVIRIQHNKPLLEDSDIQWKMTAGALAVSDDYGETWNAGIDAQGNSVINVLNAVGINADWIRAGSLSVSNNEDVIFQADLDAGRVYVSGDYVFIGDQSATEALSQLAGALTVTLSNEMQGIPVDSDGHYDTFPTVETVIRVFYGAEDVTSQATVTANALGVTGTLVYSSGTQTYVYTATSLTDDTGYVAFTATYASQTAGTLTNSKRFNLYKAYAGKDGPAGSAILYSIEPSVDIVKRGADEVCSPPSITFRAYSREGNTVERTAYAGLIEVDVLRGDSLTWEVVIDPVSNKTNETYTIDGEDVNNVRAVLKSAAVYDDVWWGLADNMEPLTFLVDEDGEYLRMDHTIDIVSGGDLIDIVTVPVLRDISNLTQDKAFDILTDGGTLEGLWYLNGKVYFNASYIAAGILRSQNGNTYWNLDTGAFNMESGAINLGNGMFVVNSGGALTARNANIIGNIVASSLTLSGNASIPYSKISDPPNLTFYIQKDQTIGTYPDNDTVTGFRVASNGLLRAANAVIYGTIYAKAGAFTGDVTASSLTLGSGVYIDYSKISNTPNLIEYVKKDGTIGSTPESGATGFVVSSVGALRASNAIIYGTIYASAGVIGGCSIVNNTLQIKSANITGTLTGKAISGGTITGTTVTGATISGSTIKNSNNVSFVEISDGNLSLYRTEEGFTPESPSSLVYRTVLANKLTTAKLYEGTGELGSSSYWFTDRVNIYPAGRIKPSTGEGDFTEYNSLGAAYNAQYIHIFQIRGSGVAFLTTTDAYFYKNTTFAKNVYVEDDFRAYGRKSRVVQTEDYGKRLLYCYETPTPMFGDIGDGVINEDGVCYVQIDPTFSETIQTSQYQVFLQAYGDGKCYVKERKSSYFIVAGSPGIEFGWEIKAKQFDSSQLRLERDDPDVRIDNTDYGNDYYEHSSEITVDYGTLAETHIEEVNAERIWQ